MGSGIQEALHRYNNERQSPRVLKARLIIALNWGRPKLKLVMQFLSYHFDSTRNHAIDIHVI